MDIFKNYDIINNITGYLDLMEIVKVKYLSNSLYYSIEIPSFHLPCKAGKMKGIYS